MQPDPNLLILRIFSEQRQYDTAVSATGEMPLHTPDQTPLQQEENGIMQHHCNVKTIHCILHAVSFWKAKSPHSSKKNASPFHVFKQRTQSLGPVPQR
jgi:hypothetical protein